MIIDSQAEKELEDMKQNRKHNEARGKLEAQCIVLGVGELWRVR